MAMIEELTRRVKQHESEQELRVIIIAAEGPVFSAGHNMRELLPEAGRQQHELVFKKSESLMMSIVESPVPVIAKVDGVAAAAGCQLVAQCDMAVCTDVSKFSTPGANFGIFCSTPGIPIARSVKKMTALRMLFTGLPITAQEAKECGLVSLVCAKEDLDAELLKITSAIIQKSRSVIELGKRFYYKQIRYDIGEAYSLGSTVMVDNINLKDGQEGIKSFVEKRKATWSHTFK
ncbi:enoyl-coa hydratase/isomerase [Holotrichia oblita]|uniref:Enoyl-coa hydratase/isomerase n=1 Tax=Holotrichia oblita TaxID=644536 RepID=A0ACB9SMJ7_HOLOL|nr:enoyl-coa hydratase/isomerase [Holotrichia oblita]